ncbi:hypothetical protein MMC08_003991 [Hypocenomyce scalaris]|nr:hypothetical protein [Hypocenomyce scalaris]
MPESTPLLPKVNRPPHEHPIFHRVCHSPWLFINQRSLLALRGFLAIYMSVILVLELSFEIFQRERGRYFVFLISNFSYAIQTTYYWITFLWTVQHYMTPHRQPVRIAGDDRGFLAKVKAAVSIPTHTDVNSKRRIAFSLFYTTAVTLPFVTTVVFWLVLVSSHTYLGPRAASSAVPMEQVLERDSLGVTFLRNFLIVNLNAINSVIALLEIMILSSVRKQKPFGTHLSGLLLLTVLYLAWAGVIGRLLTGKFIYKFLDPDYHGLRAVALVVVEMVGLVTNMFLFQRGLHLLRERLTWKAECDRQGH